VTDARWRSNGVLQVGVAPRLGGRLLALRLRETELVYRNAQLVDADLRPTAAAAQLPPVDGTLASWRNWGGDKTWPAPQGWSTDAEWHGPPDPVLDGGAYEASEEDGAVAMRSATDPRTGLRIVRRVRLDADAAKVTLDLAFENVAARRVRWAIWNVTQVPGGGEGVFVGVDDPAVVVLFAATGTPGHARAAPGVLHVPTQDVVGKLGFPGAVGWLAQARGGIVLTQRWPVSEDADYPDRGSRAEVWLQHPVERPLEDLGGLRPSDRVVELEALGPLVDLAPGEQSTLEVEIGACAVPAPVLAVGAHGCVSRPLTARREGDGLRVAGCAGTFASGPAQLAWLERGGHELGVHALGEASPHAPVDVSAVVEPPSGAAAIALRVGGRELDRTELP
jgi:Domain of unknown function (DUF4380)